MQGKLPHTHAMGAVRLVFAILCLVAGVRGVTLSGTGNGPSKCGDIGNLLAVIQNAHQSTSEQDAANRLLLLVDTHGWSQYCVRGVCLSGLSNLAAQFYEESTIFSSWVPSQLRDVRYGEHFASARFTLSIRDVCGTVSTVDAEFIFYCHAQQNRATQIHTFFETAAYNTLHATLQECVRAQEETQEQEENKEPISTAPNVLPEPEVLERPPKFILEEEENGAVIETPSPVEG